MFNMNKSLKRILYDAERKLRKGWSQGFATRSKDGTPLELDLIRQGYKPHFWCISGAVSHACGWTYDDQWDEATKLLCKALARKTKKRVSFDLLIKWNDSPRRKKKDILEVIRIARELA